VPTFEAGRRVSVAYAINAEQAAIVREVFERCAKGEGYRTIAKELNRRGVAAPRAGRRGSGSWAPTMIREMLIRERYVGVLVWGKAAKAYRGGTKVRLVGAAEDLVRVERPELRIVSPELWKAVRARMKPRRSAWRAGAVGPRPRYLLSGLARCAECGGPIGVSNTKAGKQILRAYGCSHHRNRGDAICGNTLRRPVASVDAGVIDWIEANVLREELVTEVLQEVRRRLAEHAKKPSTEAAELEAEARRLRAEIDRLVSALAAGTESPTVANAINQRETRLSQVRGRLDVLSAAPSVLDLEVRRLEKEARARLADLRGLLGRNPAEGRKALEALLAGPLTFAPVDADGGRRYQIEGSAALGAMFTTEGVPNGIRRPEMPTPSSTTRRSPAKAMHRRARPSTTGAPWIHVRIQSKRHSARRCYARAGTATET
jgi:site-specific DNA recombinase